MSGAPPPSLKSSNLLQDLNSLITKFEDDGDPDLWFTDAKHPDLEVINDKVVRSPPNQVISSGIKKRIQNKKFGSKESALLQSSLLKDGEWLCLKCQFRSREKKVILYHIFSFHHKVILTCTKCPFKTEKSQELILHSSQHKIRHIEPLNGIKHSSTNQNSDRKAQGHVLINENIFSSSLQTRTTGELNTGHGNTFPRLIGNTRLPREPSAGFHKTAQTPSKSTAAATGQKKYFHKCKRCGVVFSSIPSLQQHMKQYHQIKSVISKFNCSQCKFYGFKQEDVKDHFYQVHFSKTQHDQIVRSKLESVRRPTPVTPTQSKLPIIPVKGLNTNIKSRGQSHVCSICHTKFDSEISMKTHLIMDEGFNQQCSYCKSLFRSKMHLANHLKRCKKKTILDGLQINAKPAIENSVIEDTGKSESRGENKLSLTETCSSLLDILGTMEEGSDG